MAIFNNLGTESSNLSNKIYKGEELSDRDYSIITSDYLSGKKCGFMHYGLETERLQPEKIIKNITEKDIKKPEFLFLLGYLIKKGLDLNFYYTGYLNIHIAVFIYTKSPENPYRKYINDLLKTSGCNFNTLAYTGNNVDSKTVAEVIKVGSIQLDEEIDLKDLIFKKDLGSYKLPWNDIKKICLDKAKSSSGGILSYLKNSKNQALNLAYTFKMLCLANSVNLINALDMDPLFLNTFNGIQQSVFLSIKTQNYQIFELVLDKGASVSYPGMVEIISKYNLSERDRLLKGIYGKMISYAIKTGSYIDNYLIQMLSMEATVELLDSIREDYSKPLWKKLCRNKISNKKNYNKKLRQIAFNLNLDYGMTPEEICEKLETISNEDRVKYAEESIRKQEIRVEKEIIEKGSANETDNLDALRCDPKTKILKDPYAYGDGHISFYVDKKTKKLWCFTSDLFDTLIKTKKNPYTNQELPESFLETIKTKNHVLQFLHLKKGSQVTASSVKETLEEVYDIKNEINNLRSDKEYNIFINHLSVLASKSEIDIRQELKPMEKAGNILRNFVNFSFIYFSNYNDRIFLDTGLLSKSKDSFDNNDISVEYLEDSSLKWPTDLMKYKGELRKNSDSTLEIAFIFSDLKIYDDFKDLDYRKYMERGFFTEVYYRLTAYQINYLIDKFLKSRFYYGETQTSYGGRTRLKEIIKKSFF